MEGGFAVWWRQWRYSDAYNLISALVVTVTVVGGAYGEAHPRQISDQVPAGSAAAHTPDAAFLLVAAACLVLAGRRRYPVPVLAASTAAVMAYSLLGYVNGAASLAPSIAFFVVAESLPRWRALGVAAVAGAGLIAASLPSNPFGPTGGAFILIPALIAVPVLAGIAARSRNAYAASIEERTEADASRRVDEERLRIARELHDIVAHSMATINVQAGVAEHVLAENPAAAGAALHAIKIASKDGLRELRAILNVLRQADEGDPTQPAPGLAQLSTLISGATEAGLPTALQQDGEQRPLPAGLDLAAYRIIQESLTNAIRHAGPAAASVGVSYAETALRIEVTDSGHGVAAGQQGAGTGHGLIGMRERAASVGGTLAAGPLPGGGYRVVAVLPFDGGDAASAASPAAGPAGSASTLSGSGGEVSPGSAASGSRR